MPQFFKRDGQFLTLKQLREWEAKKASSPAEEEEKQEAEQKALKEKIEAEKQEKEKLQKELDEKEIKYDKRLGSNKLKELLT